MVIPPEPRKIIERLESKGFRAFAVGGCVRDSLLGREPKDWDICTSALPEETKQCFPDCRVVETGLKHGTVTVLLDQEAYEITTFRSDGIYTDHRRPKRVAFVDSLEEDLSRRDFTINAMAANLDGEVMDPFGGKDDLQFGVIRCVGAPGLRFSEDALRILRGLRFAARLGFCVEENTVKAMTQKAGFLTCVSGERIYKELSGILLGEYAPKVLFQYSGIIAEVLPEIVPSVGFLQKNPFHHRDVWGHTLEALSKSPPELRIRWALLLHDLGKPECFSQGEDGNAHFYGHPQRSLELAQEIFQRFRVDKATTEIVCRLVRDHDREAQASLKNARRWVAQYGEEEVHLLLEVKRCDCLAHADTPRNRLRYDNLREMTRLIEQVLETEQCFSVRDLPVTGRDILALGVSPGPQVGRLLQELLEAVLDGECPPERQALLGRLKERIAYGS